MPTNDFELTVPNLYIHSTDTKVRLTNVEDTVHSVEDDMTAIQVENDEMQQRLTVLEETVTGIHIGSCICFLRQSNIL